MQQPDNEHLKFANNVEQIYEIESPMLMTIKNKTIGKTILSIEEVEGKVKEAIELCESKIQEDEYTILSEADFEMRLSNAIEDKLKGSQYSVHHQLPHKVIEGEKINKRPDIVVLDESQSVSAGGDLMKNDSPNITFELKYLRYWNDTYKEYVQRDFDKIEKLSHSVTLYVVVLMAIKDKDNFDTAKDDIEGMCSEKNRNYPKVRQKVCSVYKYDSEPYK